MRDRKYLFIFTLILALAFLVISCAEKRSVPTIPGIHPASWMQVSSIDFHAKVVLSTGTAGCKECHGSDLDGGKVNVSCIDCHAERSDVCTGCHGGLIDNSGAPPYGLRGEESHTSRAVGAHTAHLDSPAFSRPVSCTDCHTVPAFAFDTNHFDSLTPTGAVLTDSIAEIVWGGFADGGSADWNRTDQICSGTYCHGSFTGGNANNAPIWNQENQAECGSCHDIGTNPSDLGWRHEFHISTAGLECADCHASVINSAMEITGINLHVNGMADTLTADTAKCNVCHGEGGLSCVGCHGGLDNNTGAPPYGLERETATSELAVGAHTAHMEGGSLADAFACSDCHIVPSSISSAGHLDGDNVAEMTWSSLAGGASNWNRTTAVCSDTYCHGNFSGGYRANSPVWTATSQANCGSCHDAGANPEDLSGEHKKHFIDLNIPCRNCHSLTQGVHITIVGPEYHVDGIKTVSLIYTGSYSNGSCSGLPGGCHGTKSWND